jgi:type VI protein secretion system component Hcp
VDTVHAFTPSITVGPKKGIYMIFKDRVLCALVTGSICLGTALPALAGNLIYLHIPGVTGDVQDKGFQGDIRLTSYSQAFTSTYTGNGNGGGGGAGKTTCGAITFQKSVDDTSEFFLSHVVQGTEFAHATVDFVHAGGSAETAPYTVTLGELRVTSVSQGDNSTTTAATLGVQETVTVVAQTFEFSYRTMNADGSEGAQMKFNWNCRTNSRF